MKKRLRKRRNRWGWLDGLGDAIGGWEIGDAVGPLLEWFFSLW